MASLRKFDFGTFTRNEEVSSPHQFSGTPNHNNNNSFAPTPANNDSFSGGGGGGGGTPASNSNLQQQNTAALPPQIPKLQLEGQQPLDKKFLYSTGVVRFVGYVQTSEPFVEGKSGGINSDLLDAATAKGGYDPAEAVAKANRVWKERTFVVEPSKAGWTLHIVKSKLGGETAIKHSIKLSDVSNIDIMTSQQPGRKFQVHARTTADTQAKTHFMLEFQSYISIAVGKQHLEITCRTPEAVVRNYTFLVNCLQATAVLTQHTADLVAAEKLIDKLAVSVHLRTIVNEVTGQTAPIKFDCAFSLSTKAQEPHVQLRGDATISSSLFHVVPVGGVGSASQQQSATATPSAGDGFGAPPTPSSNNNNNNNNVAPGMPSPKKPENIKVRGKFRILLHPLNLNPPTTEEGIRVIVQSDEHHMVPVELRPVAGKTKTEFTDVQRLKRALVTIIENMMAMGSAMSGPRLAMESVNQTGQNTVMVQQQDLKNKNSNSNNENQQQQAAGSPSSSASPRNTNSNQQQQQSNTANASPATSQQQQQPKFASSGSIGSSYANNNQNQNQQNLPVVPGKATTSTTTTTNSNNNNPHQQQNQNSSNVNHWNVLNSTSRMAFGTGFNPNHNRNMFRGNIIEQLETGTRMNLENTFLELLRTLAFASVPTRGMSMKMSGVGANVNLNHQNTSSPHQLASQQNTSMNNYSSVSSTIQQQQQTGGEHPLATSPRFMHQHSMQRNGSVPIAVTQIANTSTSYYSSPSSAMMSPRGVGGEEKYKVVVDPATGKELIRNNFNNNNNDNDVNNNNFAWDFRHTNTWPMMMPGDDVQDFRLHLTRILKHRAGKSLKQSTNSTNTSSNNNVVGASGSPMGSPMRR